VKGLKEHIGPTFRRKLLRKEVTGARHHVQTRVTHRAYSGHQDGESFHISAVEDESIVVRLDKVHNSANFFRSQD
jgi:hypothetical protein